MCIVWLLKKNLLGAALWQLWPASRRGTGQRAGNGSISWVLGSRPRSEAVRKFLNSKREPKTVLVCENVMLWWLQKVRLSQ